MGRFSSKTKQPQALKSSHFQGSAKLKDMGVGGESHQIFIAAFQNCIKTQEKYSSI